MWNKADKIIGAIGSFASIASVSMVSILGILQVFFRFVFHINAPWTEELMRALYIYVVFFGLILVEKENSEIRTTMLIEKLPSKLYNVWEIIVSVTSIFFNILVIIRKCAVSAHLFIKNKCRWPDSNRHGVTRLILSQVRLPIPPQRHGVRFLPNTLIISYRYANCKKNLSFLCYFFIPVL